MNNTTPANRFRAPHRGCALVVLLGLIAVLTPASHAQDTQPMNSTQVTAPEPSETLTAHQQAIVPIAAFTAVGDMDGLHTALNRGLDAGLTVSAIKEVLVQLYAYAGFPRSLNALGEFMQLLEARKAAGIHDPAGREPGPLPAPDRMLEVGTANQTKLAGAPVTGGLFEFSPQVDRYLKEHLFGAIFARDNLDWQDRELATLGALAAMPGLDSQLAAHMRIGRNVDVREAQLQQAVSILRERVSAEAADRAEAARSKSATR